MRAYALIAVLLVSCVVGEDDLPTENDLPPAISEAGLGNNVRTAFNYFVSKGLTDIQAAGVVGNLMQESGVRPTAVQYGGGPGRGIAQWSIGGRWNAGRVNLVAFASTRGLARWTLQTQLDFIWHELTTSSALGLADLRAATTLSSAVTAFQNKYEICGACAKGKRVEYAQQTLANYGTAAGGTSGETPPPPAPTSVTCYSGTLARDMPENTCVQSMYDDLWYQCSNGEWIDRWSDPDACSGEYPL